MYITTLLLRALSVLSVVYFLLLVLFSGIRTSFLWFWLLLAAFSFVCSLLLPRLTHYQIFLSMLWGLAAAFLIIEGIFIFYAFRRPQAAPEYVIILGAQVRGDTPSKVLQKRIDAAADYLEQYPLAIAVCSGGQGKGENISEAEAIRRGLLEKGIEEERILLEDRSTSTLENITYSMEIIGDESLPVTIITNDFHMFRALHIAKKQGLINAQGCSAISFQPVTVHYYVREFFAVAKDLLVGNL